MGSKFARLVINLLQSLIAPIVVIAGALYFVNQVAPELATKMMQQLLPLFVIVVVIQGAISYYSLEVTRLTIASELEALQKQVRLAVVESRAERITSVRRFQSPTDFHAYVGERFAAAKEVRVTHFSAGVTELTTDEYRNIVDAFLNRGGIYRRVLADTRSARVWREQKRMLDLYGEKRQHFMLHFLPFLAVNDMKALDIMIIDEEEVCIGGGYTQGFTVPVIAIRDPAVVKFFDKYYEYLLSKATGIRVDPFADTTFVSEMLERAENVTNPSKRVDIGPRVPISSTLPNTGSPE